MFIIDEFNVFLEFDGMFFNGVVKSIDGLVWNLFVDDKVIEGCFFLWFLSFIMLIGYWCDEVFLVLFNFELGINFCLLYIDIGCLIVFLLNEVKIDFLLIWFDIVLYLKEIVGLLIFFGWGVILVCNEIFNFMEVVCKLDVLEVVIKFIDGLIIL